MGLFFSLSHLRHRKAGMRAGRQKCYDLKLLLKLKKAKQKLHVVTFRDQNFLCLLALVSSSEGLLSVC